MSELFDEVDEDVRRDQLKKLWDKYSVYHHRGRDPDHRLAWAAGVATNIWKPRRPPRRGLPSTRRWSFRTPTSTPRPKRRLPISRRKRRPDTACCRGCALAAEIASPRSAGRRQDVRRNRRRPQRRCGRAGSGANSRRAIAAGKHQLSQHESSASKPLPHRARPFAIPRANCWPCRPGAPTMLPRRGNGWI